MGLIPTKGMLAGRLTCLVASLVTFSVAHGADLKLWYRQPARTWTEALPVGNGHLGAMVFGGTATERIQFNEDTLWKGKPHDYVRAGAGEHLAEIRRLVFTGQADAAGKLAREKAISDPVRQMPYQPFGDLRLEFPGHENVAEYRRDLDLETAIARTSYQVEGVEYQREVFASYPDRVLVVRLTASQPGRIQFSLRLDSPHTNTQTRALGPDTLALAGQLGTDGLKFEARVRVLTTGGACVSRKGRLEVEKADAVTVVLVARTSFRNFEDIRGDPAARCASDLKRLARKDYAGLRAAHLADHQRLMRRVQLELGGPSAGMPVDERLARVKQDGLASDPHLAALHFQYGRYLLIASSRPGSQPANLQGVWNEELNPPWESKYTLNINCEMNYWPAEVCNLSECHEPLFDLIDDLTISGARAAKKQYGARGWVVHHNTDLWRGAAPINNIDGFWPTGGAWLCHHLWEHYLFTGDRDFLRKRAYPAMKSAALFFVDFLVPDLATGYLVTCPSHSPEQAPPGRPLFAPGPTMDNQLIRALLTYTIEAAGILGVDDRFARQLAGIRGKLPPNKIGRHGQLQEWLEDWDAPNNNHRHLSPLFALYPGWEINPANAPIYDAARRLLEWRGDGTTGWSFAWRMALRARTGDGEQAFKQFQGLLQRRTLPNLFDLCGPFQIDGNFGACAAVAEMLLQSHLTAQSDSEVPARIVDLLPALPGAWKDGAISGLRARDGFQVDLEWKDGRLLKALVRSDLGRPLRIRYAGHELALTLKRGETLVLGPELKPQFQSKP
jgi:alpha-L-fucosidase 2